MYIVTIKNGSVETEIHSHTEKLASGNVVKGINSIDSFSFTLLPSNIGFNRLEEFQTLVKVYNTNKKRYEFYGRVLYSNPSMDEKGLITKSISCESYFGFLCDSVQPYVNTQNWTVTGLLQHIISAHNSQVEDYKQFMLGEVTVTDTNNNLYCGIQRENSWDTIKKKLIDVLGGELRFRVVDDVIYLDYLTEIGGVRSTEIALSKNMQSIRQEKDPSSYVTRLIPLGCKLKDDTGEDTEERLDIASVNGGLNYIDDTQAIREYGIHVGVQTWNDVSTATVLLSKGKKWLTENNKVKVKYSITALDLSLIGLDIDDFDVGYSHPLKNALLGIDDIARIIKKNINVCDEIASTIEVGESFKSLSDIQKEYLGKINDAANVIEKIESNYVTNEKLASETIELNSLINQTAQDIVLQVSSDYVNKTDEEEYRKNVKSQIDVMLGQISLKASQTEVDELEVDIGEIQVSTNDITARVKDAEGNIGTLTTRSDEIEARVDDAEGNISTLTQTVNGFETEVAGKSKTFVQFSQPSGTFDAGDTWVKTQASQLWNTLKGMTWNDTKGKVWGEWGYTAQPQTYVWDGAKWVMTVDYNVVKDNLTTITQTRQQISLKANQTTVNALSGKVTENTSEIRQTAKDITLMVEGKADKGEPASSVETTSVSINTDGVNIKTGGTFTVDSGNFDIDASGNMSAQNAYLSGAVYVNGSPALSQKDIYVGTNAPASPVSGMVWIKPDTSTSAQTTFTKQIPWSSRAQMVETPKTGSLTGTATEAVGTNYTYRIRVPVYIRPYSKGTTGAVLHFDVSTVSGGTVALSATKNVTITDYGSGNKVIEMEATGDSWIGDHAELFFSLYTTSLSGYYAYNVLNSSDTSAAITMECISTSSSSASGWRDCAVFCYA